MKKTLALLVVILIVIMLLIIFIRTDEEINEEIIEEIENRVEHQLVPREPIEETLPPIAPVTVLNIPIPERVEIEVRYTTELRSTLTGLRPREVFRGGHLAAIERIMQETETLEEYNTEQIVGLYERLGVIVNEEVLTDMLNQELANIRYSAFSIAHTNVLIEALLRYRYEGNRNFADEHEIVFDVYNNPGVIMQALRTASRTGQEIDLQSVRFSHYYQHLFEDMLIFKLENPQVKFIHNEPDIFSGSDFLAVVIDGDEAYEVLFTIESGAIRLLDIIGGI